MLIFALLAILHFAFVINKPIFNWWRFQSREEIAPEASVRHLDTVFINSDILWHKHEYPEPVWTRHTEQGTEESHQPLMRSRENFEVFSSHPWVKRVLIFYNNPIVLAIDCGFEKWAINHYEKKIIKEEAKVLSNLYDCYEAMYWGDLMRAKDHLKDAVRHDGLSHSYKKMYHEVNAPLIKFRDDDDYLAKWEKVDKMQQLLREIKHEELVHKFEEIFEERIKMEKKWKKGDKRLPDPRNVVLYHDIAQSFKQKALNKAIKGLAHEFTGRQYLNEENLILAQIHYSVAKRFYDEAEKDMGSVYGTQYGTINLKSYDAYKEMIQNYKAKVP